MWRFVEKFAVFEKRLDIIFHIKALGIKIISLQFWLDLIE